MKIVDVENKGAKRKECRKQYTKNANGKQPAVIENNTVKPPVNGSDVINRQSRVIGIKNSIETTRTASIVTTSDRLLTIWRRTKTEDEDISESILNKVRNSFNKLVIQYWNKIGTVMSEMLTFRFVDRGEKQFCFCAERTNEIARKWQNYKQLTDFSHRIDHWCAHIGWIYFLRM